MKNAVIYVHGKGDHESPAYFAHWRYGKSNLNDDEKGKGIRRRTEVKKDNQYFFR